MKFWSHVYHVYLKYRNFRAQKLSRTETFAHINFRGFQKSAKVYAREIFKIGRTAKVYEREDFDNMQPRKLMSKKMQSRPSGKSMKVYE